jgi:hypothetical protein
MCGGDGKTLEGEGQFRDGDEAGLTDHIWEIGDLLALLF